MDERHVPETTGAGAYRQAGVDIDAGSRAVELMRGAVRSTFGPQVLADVGYFGGAYALDNGPVLVASADSVGTKLMLTSIMGTYHKAGQDIVNHCVNDILACGAKPIFFLDYVASSHIVPEQIAETVEGMTKACRAAHCALIGGETAELPGIYKTGEFDVAGFIVGSVERERLVLGREIVPDDVVLALPSSGLHTNGYTLARKVLGLEGETVEVRERLNAYDEALSGTLADVLLEPHRSYLDDIAPLLDMPEQPLKGMAHITGGGLVDNIPRILPDGCAVEIDMNSWQVPAIFRRIEAEGRIDPHEMARVFNIGLGMALIVAPGQQQMVQAMLPGSIKVGTVIRQEGSRRVTFRDGGAAWK